MAFEIGNISSTGKILQWSGNSIAINKINSIDLSFKRRSFPILALFVVVIGIVVVFKFKFVPGLILTLIGVGYIYWWSKHQEYDYTVNLRTSSTEPFRIYFGNDVQMGKMVKQAIIKEMSELND